MRYLFIVLISISYQAFSATECSMSYKSNMPGELPYSSLKDKTEYGLTLEDCVQFAKSKIGKKTRRKSLVFDDWKVITEVIFSFKDKGYQLKGTFSK